MTERAPEQSDPIAAAAKAVAKQVSLTRTSMSLERLNQAFWPVWTAGILIVALSAFGLLDMFSSGAVSVVLALMALGLLG
ncbi:MAG: hypothetical protein AAGK98_16255, partial [Pseudomonadota bacterium]